ncbi:MAG: lamin tail domain-containing protein [Planctomycetota bacterium]
MKLSTIATASIAAAFTTGAFANTVAITEFINDVQGSESALEWVEIYNYGTSAVDLTGWTLGDEDSDLGTFAGFTLGSGEYAILADDAAAFIAEWGVGVLGVNVIEIDTLTLANGADELILSDSGSNAVWSLAYDNDETAGISTYLAVDDFSNTVFGSKAAPGVDRNGDDIGIPGFLGYESGGVGVDPNAFASLVGNGSGSLNEGSPLAGDYSVVIPTPGALALLGLAGFAGTRRRRG